MSIKRDMGNLYHDLPPREKARLWLKYHIDGASVPADLLAGMSEVERTEYERSRIILSSVHVFGDIELSRIEAELKAVDLRYVLLLQVRWMLDFSYELRRRLDFDKVKEPLTASEHACLLEEAGQELMSLDNLVTELLERADVYPSPDADTDKGYRAAWRKKEKELKELVALGQLESEQEDGEVYIRWGDWCRVSGENLNPHLDYSLEARVFPDEMASAVEEMRQERADLRELISQPYADLMEDGDSVMTYILSIIAPGLPSVPSGPFRPKAILALARDTLASELKECWRRLAVVKRVFERAREEEFDGRDIFLESPILEGLERVRLMATPLGRVLGVEEGAIEVDEDSADEVWRGLVGKGKRLG